MLNLSSTEPEFTLEESERIPLMEKQLAYLSQTLLDLEVDSVVLYKELTKLEGMSGRITDSLRELRLSVQEQQ